MTFSSYCLQGIKGSKFPKKLFQWLTAGPIMGNVTDMDESMYLLSDGTVEIVAMSEKVIAESLANQSSMSFNNSAMSSGRR